MKKITVFITGTTGMVGKGVLLECLQAEFVEKVILVNRVSVGIQNPKIVEYLHQDFTDISLLEPVLTGIDACFLCMGVSSFNMKEEVFHKLTYTITTHIAGVISKNNPQAVCTYVSGTGTDSTEQGRIMWARVKGKTENALLHMPFKAAYMFRAGYIQPMDGIKSKTKLYNALYVVFKPLYPILKNIAPKYFTSTRNVGRAMLYLSTHTFTLTHLENNHINECAGLYEF